MILDREQLDAALAAWADAPGLWASPGTGKVYSSKLRGFCRGVEWEKYDSGKAALAAALVEADGQVKSILRKAFASGVFPPEIESPFTSPPKPVPAHLAAANERRRAEAEARRAAAASGSPQGVQETVDETPDPLPPSCREGDSSCRGSYYVYGGFRYCDEHYPAGDVPEAVAAAGKKADPVLAPGVRQALEAGPLYRLEGGRGVVSPTERGGVERPATTLSAAEEYQEDPKPMTAPKNQALRPPPLPRSRISEWLRGASDRVRFFRQGTGALAGKPLAVGRPGGYSDADMAGSINLTDFVQQHLQPEFGPFPGDDPAVYFAQAIDATGRDAGLPQEIAVQAPRGRVEVPPLPAAPVPQQPQELGPMEKIIVDRAQSDAAEARAALAEVRARAEHENAELRRANDDLRRKVDGLAAQLALPPPAPPPVMGDVPPESAALKSLDLARHVIDQGLARPREAAGPSAFDLVKQVTDSVMTTLKPVLDMVAADRERHHRGVADPEVAQLKAEVDRLKDDRITKLADEMRELRTAKVVDPGDMIEKTLKHIDTLVAAGRKIAGDGEGSSSPGVDVARAIGGTLSELAHSPFAQAIARRAMADEGDEKPVRGRVVDEAPQKKQPAPVQQRRPAAIPSSVQHALRGLTEARGDGETGDALSALVGALAGAGGPWAKKAEALQEDFLRIETVDELQFLVVAVFKGLNADALLREHVGLAHRVAHAVGRRYTEIHELLTGRAKSILGVDAAPRPDVSVVQPNGAASSDDGEVADGVSLPDDAPADDDVQQ